MAVVKQSDWKIKPYSALFGALKVVESFVSNKGVAFLAYEPAGDVPIGSFATQEPSEAELKRREKFAREDA